jgi:hypothetical protein
MREICLPLIDMMELSLAIVEVSLPFLERPELRLFRVRGGGSC